MNFVSIIKIEKMKDKIYNWLQRIDQQTDRVNTFFGKLTDEQLYRKPGEKIWSVAENLQHLIVINNSYFPAIEIIRAGKQKLGFLSKFAFIRKFFGKMIIAGVQADRKKKMKTFAVWQPAHFKSSENLIETFVKHQESIKKLISDSEDLLLKNAIIASPANKNIVYSLADAFEIIVTHEERHVNQAAELLKVQNN
jgi:uncharacterized damage-inducible protein DinB